MSPTIPYGKQTINSEDIKLVTKVLKSDYLTTKFSVEKFENSFKKKFKICNKLFKWNFCFTS